MRTKKKRPRTAVGFYCISARLCARYKENEKSEPFSFTLTTLERKGLLSGALSELLCRYTHLRLCIPRPSGLRIYYTTSFDICQGVFQKFFEIFQKTFLTFFDFYVYFVELAYNLHKTQRIVRKVTILN